MPNASKDKADELVDPTDKELFPDFRDAAFGPLVEWLGFGKTLKIRSHIITGNFVTNDGRLNVTVRPVGFVIKATLLPAMLIDIIGTIVFHLLAPKMHNPVEPVELLFFISAFVQASVFKYYIAKLNPAAFEDRTGVLYLYYYGSYFLVFNCFNTIFAYVIALGNQLGVLQNDDMVVLFWIYDILFLPWGWKLLKKMSIGLAGVLQISPEKNKQPWRLVRHYVFSAVFGGSLVTVPLFYLITAIKHLVLPE